MSELAGTWQLVRFTVRRDRLRIVMWIGSVTALVVATALSVKGLFPTQADLDQAAAAAAKNAAAIAFNGPVQGLDTVGGQVAFQAGTIGLVLVALMSLLMTGRYTRVEEESGRTELLRATVVGRDAQTAVALLVVAGMNLLVGAAVALGLIGAGLPVAGSMSFGVSLLAIGVVFTALALVTAQLSENSRAASGLAGVVLGSAFVVRAVGDIGDGRLSWLSPIGWSQKMRPYAGERWWPVLVPLAVTVLLLMTARALSARRDWGAGLVQPRPGPATASAHLGRPLGLAVRLQRASLLSWTAALAVFGLFYGSLADDISDFVGDSQTLKDLLAAAGGGPSLVDSYFGTAMLVLALVGSCFGVQCIQRLRGEESALHTEVVLATPTARHRWMGGYLAVACGGSVVVLTAAGLGAGIPYAVETRDAGQVAALVGAALAYLPAVVLLVGVAAALYGLAPRAVPAVWVVVVACFVIGFLGGVLKLPRLLVDLSPFRHTPALPAASLTLAPLVTLSGLAAALVGIGLLTFGHRDIG